jgi:hypothetical protein
VAILDEMADRIILKRFEFPHEAELCASFLRDQGIDASVDDALLVGPNPLMNIAYGGVKVRINENELERANELLAELDQSSIDADESHGADSDDDAERGQSRSALSVDEQRIRRAHAAALIGLVTLPGVVHAYSLYLAVTVRDADLSEKGRSLRRFALVVSTLMVGFALWVVTVIVRRAL